MAEVLQEHREALEGQALVTISLTHKELCQRTLPRRCALAGAASGQRLHPQLFGQRPDLITTPARFGLLLRRAPLDIRAAFWYGVVGKGGAPAMAAATTRFSGRAFSAREVTLIREVVRDCSGLSRMELARTVCELLRWRRPNGGLKARECREFLERLDADGALVLPDKRRGRALGSVTRVSPDGGGRAGAPARGQRARCRAVGYRAGARACRTPAVPGVGGPLPLPRAHGPLRRPPALSGIRVEASAGGGRLSAVLQSGVAHGGAGQLGRLGRCDSGAESPARGQQQPFLLLPWVGVKEPRQRGAGARPRALGSGLAATLRPGAVARRDAGGPVPLPRRFVSRRQLVALGATSGRGRMDRHGRRAGEAPKTVLVYPVVRDPKRRLRES